MRVILIVFLRGDNVIIDPRKLHIGNLSIDKRLGYFKAD